MLKYIIGIHIGLINTSNAATAKVVFTDSKGAVVSVEKALEISSKGETVLRCQPVKAAVSKSGTSISFKVVK